MHNTARKLVVTAALLLGTTLAMSTSSFARPYYDYAPGYGYAPGYYDPDYGFTDPGLYSFAAVAAGIPISPPSCDRGGPGPRVKCGTGQGIGAER